MLPVSVPVPAMKKAATDDGSTHSVLRILYEN
jgi:hypothetical protein